MTKEEKFAELCAEMDKKDRALQEEIGMGICDFKDDGWRSLSVKFDSSGTLGAFAWLSSKFNEYLVHTLDEATSYDIVFCVKKSPERPPESFDEHTKKRIALGQEFQEKQKAIEEEFKQQPEATEAH